MYDFIDRRVICLDNGGRFLIWAMRSWVKAAHARQCPCGTMAAAFAHWRLGDGLATFHRMMLLFNNGSIEEFGFGTLGCQQVHEHEALILGLVHDFPQSSEAGVRATLGLVVREEMVSPLLAVIGQLGRIMAASGIFPGKPSLHPQIEGMG